MTLERIVKSFGVERARKCYSAIVIQGNYVKDQSENTIRIFFNRNPESLIVVCSYTNNILDFDPEGKWTTELSSGRLVFLFIDYPCKTKFFDFWKTNFFNQNLQRLTSFIGVNFVKEIGIPICLKVRSDSFLGRPNICQYLNDVSNEKPLLLREGENIGLKRRMVNCNRSRRKCFMTWEDRLGEYFLFDHWMFGDTGDLIKFYEIEKGGNDINVGQSPESSLTELWMKREGITDCQDGVAELCARYFAIVDTAEVEFLWQKVESFGQYIREGSLYIQREFEHRSRMFRHFTKTEWLEWIEIIKTRDAEKQALRS